VGALVDNLWNKFQMKVVAGSAAVMFGVAVLVMSFLAISNPAVVHPSSDERTVTAAPVQATSEAMIKMEYYLPYPGILPDSPLYKIKALRDRLELWLTFAEPSKAKKELVFADKRINAAIFLMQGGKSALAVSTATKAEKYLQTAVGRTVGESSKGTDVKSMLAELIKSTSKHLEVIGDLKGKVQGDDLKALETAEKTTQFNLQRLQQTLREAK
jgi:hypothetical protein